MRLSFRLCILSHMDSFCPFLLLPLSRKMAQVTSVSLFSFIDAPHQGFRKQKIKQMVKKK